MFHAYFLILLHLTDFFLWYFVYIWLAMREITHLEFPDLNCRVCCATVGRLFCAYCYILWEYVGMRSPGVLYSISPANLGLFGKFSTPYCLIIRFVRSPTYPVVQIIRSLNLPAILFDHFHCSIIWTVLSSSKLFVKRIYVWSFDFAQLSDHIDCSIVG